MAGDARARQAITILAVAAVFVGLRDAVGGSSSSPLVVTVLLATGFAVVLGLGIAAACTTDPRWLSGIDVATLLVGMSVALAQFAGATAGALLGGTDEQLLNRLAMTTVLHDHNPYTQVYKLVGVDGNGTPLLSGGQANTYGYPPLSLEIGRVFGFINPSLAAPGLVGAFALVVVAVAAFVALPVQWRALSIVMVFGFDRVTPSAIAGFPIVLAVALLVGPVWRWTATGAGGRLGRVGVTQGVLLGLAAAAQQLSWFVAVFLLASIYLVRRGEIGARLSAAVVGRYGGIALATFLVVNAPFIVDDPGAWARAMAAPLVQNAVVAGSGWALPMIEANGGTGTLAVLSLAPPLLLVGVLVVYSVGLRRFAPAMALLPSVVFLVSSRSSPQYFYSFIPLWLVAAATPDRTALALSRPLTLPRVLDRFGRTRWGWVALGLGAILPAALTFLIGVTGRPPMTMHPDAAVVYGTRIDTVTVTVTNNTDHVIDPQYFIDQRLAITHPWVPQHGPRVLQPHQTAVVVLQPRTSFQQASAAAGLWVVSTIDNPAGMAARPIRLRPGQVTVHGIPGGSRAARARRLCITRLLGGTRLDCNTQLGLSSTK